MRRTTIISGSILFLMTLAATAQESPSEISLQGTGFFTKSSSGNGTAYSPTETGGFLSTYRYHLNRWISAEAAYGYDGNSQKYLFFSNAFTIQSGIHQATGSLVLNLPSRPSSRFTPYVLAGGGALVFSPTTNQVNSLSGAQAQAKSVFVYGVGVNYAVLKRLSLRAEYRGLVYGTPDFGFGALSTNSITHTAQPSVGVTFRF